MIVLDDLLIGGLRFVLDKVASAVESEMNDEQSLKEDLLAAQMRLELGEIDDGEFAEIEAGVVARLREIREAREGAPQGAMSMGRGVAVDVSFGGDEE